MSNISRRSLLQGIGGASVFAALPSGANSQAIVPATKKASAARIPYRGKPNVLFITLEGVPLDAISCYGSRLIQTPGLDRIAREGMQFQNSFTTNALCAPARAVLLTGKYNHLNGMVANEPSPYGKPVFDPSQETLPKILKRNGYQTGMVGKWHLPANPGDAGFDYYVYKKGAGGPYYEATGWLRNETLGSNATVPATLPGYESDILVDLTIDAIGKFDKPFFMMLQFFNDHRPWEPKHEYEHMYDGVRIPEPGTFWDDYSDRASAARDSRIRVERLRGIDTPNGLSLKQQKQWNYQRFMSLFLSTLRALDDNIVRLLNWMDETGLSETTAVVVTGDHGFFLGDHGFFDKRLMYEQALRVPQLLRYPKTVKAGTTSKELIVNIDNAPSVLALCGIATPATMQGQSYLGIAQGKQPEKWRQSTYYHYYEFTNPHYVYPHYGVRTSRYKLISYYSINQWELFDLEKDPDEMENLFEWNGFEPKPGYEKLASDLIAELTRLRAQYGDTTGPPVQFIPPSRMN